MPIPASLHGRFRVPAIAAPMFLVSGPELVIAACQAGVAGTFPALNARPAARLDQWLGEIDTALASWQAVHPGQPCAPHGVNLILHPSNERLAEDLATVVRHKVPLVLEYNGSLTWEARHWVGKGLFHEGLLREIETANLRNADLEVRARLAEVTALIERLREVASRA